MRKRRQKGKQTDAIFPLKIDELETLIKSKFENNSDEDLIFSSYEHQGQKIAVFGISYLIDTDQLESSLLTPLLNKQEPWTNQDLLSDIPLEGGAVTDSLQELLNKIIIGEVFIYIEEEKYIVSYPLAQKEKRDLTVSENESVILGPAIGFTESLETNLNVLRQITPSSDLVIEKLVIGEKVPREVRIVYMKSVANREDVNTMRQRIQDIEVDEVESTTSLKQFVEDSITNIFPQFYMTELPSRISYSIHQGKVGVLLENSPMTFIGPSTFFSFFEAMEDIYMRWAAGTALRILRVLAMAISFLITPTYVAIVTFQYELVPTELLVSLGESRANVPFPPIIEALLIETLIELLREAGARLPTKVGQTMGIVGGIVVGEAAVQAGLTSNILIIVVAMSALATFSTPNYLMGTSFRFIRFPMILLAGLHGVIGIMFGISFLMIHLLGLTSLGRPYLAPVYPLRLQDFKDVFFRTPPQKHSKRASMYRPKDQFRYSKQKANKKRDIDE